MIFTREDIIPNHFIIPEGVTEIDSGAFSDLWNLTSITLPLTLKKIGRHAFEGCDRLKTVNFPKNLKVIRKCAFSSCLSLKEITLPSNLVKIDKYAFCDCLNLESISFLCPYTTIIDDFAFNNCPDHIQKQVQEWKERNR